MKEMGVPETEIAKFQDPLHWLGYFPPIGADHLAQFGTAIDFRRSFITTNVNPYYDAFIRWQFNTLKAKKKVNFGKRYVSELLRWLSVQGASILTPLSVMLCVQYRDLLPGRGSALRRSRSCKW